MQNMLNIYQEVQISALCYDHRENCDLLNLVQEWMNYYIFLKILFRFKKLL